MKEICFWSIGDGDHAYMLQALVYSFHKVGMEGDFFAISDRQIHGAQTYIIPHYDKSYYLFKINFLAEIFANLEYKYFVFLDADCFFVRKITDIISVLQGSPLHVFLESDTTSPLANERKGHWKNCPLQRYVQLMRNRGVRSPKVYNMNAGFILVERDAIMKVCCLVYDFWYFTHHNGWTTTEEPPLAYAMHMMCGDPEKHTLRNNPDIWASDWRNIFGNELPYDKQWNFTDFMTGELYPVRPAIVHALAGKAPLITLGKKLIKI